MCRINSILSRFSRLFMYKSADLFFLDGGVHSTTSKPPMPNEVTLQLVPGTYGDKAYVVGCQQNPFIKLRLKMNERMSRCIELLSRKWISTESRLVCIYLFSSIVFLFSNNKWRQCTPNRRTCSVRFDYISRIVWQSDAYAYDSRLQYRCNFVG